MADVFLVVLMRGNDIVRIHSAYDDRMRAFELAGEFNRTHNGIDNNDSNGGRVWQVRRVTRF